LQQDSLLYTHALAERGTGKAVRLNHRAEKSAPALRRSRFRRNWRRRPEPTLWYRIVQSHLETWLELASREGGEAPPTHIERTFRRYLECGILAHGFARACCDECQHDFLIAYSCKYRGVRLSCNTRRMVKPAAHLVDHLSPCCGAAMGARRAQTAALLPSAWEAKSMAVVLR